MSTLEIKARKNGPYKIIGNFTYTDAKGEKQKITTEDIALCRCGLSANKPFCDGKHRQIGFEAPLLYLYLNNDSS